MSAALACASSLLEVKDKLTSNYQDKYLIMAFIFNSTFQKCVNSHIHKKVKGNKHCKNESEIKFKKRYKNFRGPR